MTATRDAVRDPRDQFAFHDDIVYLRETKRGLTRDDRRGDQRASRTSRTGCSSSGSAPTTTSSSARCPTWTDGLDRDRLRQDRLLPQAVRARREVVGRRPGADQGDVREARHPRGGAQVPRRRRRPVRLRGRLPLGPRGADEDRRGLHGHRPGAQGIPGDLPEVLRHGRPARGQQVRRAQQRGLVGRLVRLRPQGRRGPAAAAGLLPDQRREHRPVRADADRRRRGRQGPLHRGLHRPDLRDRLAPRRRRRGRRAARLEGPLHDDPELVERRLQPRHQARPRVRELDGRVDRRQHRLAQDREVPVDLPARRGRHAPTSSRVAVAGKGQHQDTGAKAIHLAPNTKLADRLEVGLEGRRPGDVPRPAQGRAGRDRTSSPASAATR